MTVSFLSLLFFGFFFRWVGGGGRGVVPITARAHVLSSRTVRHPRETLQAGEVTRTGDQLKPVDVTATLTFFLKVASVRGLFASCQGHVHL